ncbi:MAG: hypothetical protein C0402_14770 [Thermodesulfovibrio sp.]|nr:hypothetical protein [Thermodesulfovibrio sp.]
MCNNVDNQRLLAEYQAAVAGFNHFDSFRWQSGSLLVAGSLVLWGIIFQGNTSDQKTIGFISLFISTLLAVWILFAHHYRQIYMSKVYRIHEIEKILDMQLNRNLGLLENNSKKIIIYGPKGHNLDIFVFIIVSLFGPLLSWLKLGFCLWVMPPLMIVVIVTSLVLQQEQEMKALYRDLSNKS